MVGPARRGHTVAPEFVVATMQASDAGNRMFNADVIENAKSFSLIVSGPLVLAVGKDSKYTVRPSDPTIALPQLAWSKVETASPDPVLAITINQKGSEATIRPHSPGSFKLKILAVGDGADQWQESFSDLIAQADPDADKGGLKIPFFGQGYGSQILRALPAGGDRHPRHVGAHIKRRHRRAYSARLPAISLAQRLDRDATTEPRN